jgi:hypothetical protein
MDPSLLPHDNLQANIIFCGIVTWLFSVTFLALRFYTRAKIVHVVAATDWCLLAATVSISSKKPRYGADLTR